jgi:hypothetical protein
VAPTHTAAIDLASAASNLTTELRLSPGTYRETFDAGVGRFDGCVFENKRSALGGGVINLGAYESPVAACPADLNDRSRTGTPDGGVTIDDLLYFLSRFEGWCGAAARAARVLRPTLPSMPTTTPAQPAACDVPWAGPLAPWAEPLSWALALGVVAATRGRGEWSAYHTLHRGLADLGVPEGVRNLDSMLIALAVADFIERLKQDVPIWKRAAWAG